MSQKGSPGPARRRWRRVVITLAALVLSVGVYGWVALQRAYRAPATWQTHVQKRQQVDQAVRHERADRLFNQMSSGLSALTAQERQNYLGSGTGAGPQSIELEIPLDQLNDWIELSFPGWMAQLNTSWPQDWSLPVFGHERGHPMVMLAYDGGRRPLIVSMVLQVTFLEDGRARAGLDRMRIGTQSVPLRWVLDRVLGTQPGPNEPPAAEHLRAILRGQPFHPVFAIDQQRGRRLVDLRVEEDVLYLRFEPADPTQALLR